MSLSRSKPFRDAFRRFRLLNQLSQQDIHIWGQSSGTPLHNSQIAYLEKENRDFDPKMEFWFSLEAFNKAIREEGPNGFKFISKKVTRERLQKSKPFLNHLNQVADMLDFFAMYAGRQPILEIYTEPKKDLNQELIDKFIKQLQVTFNTYARENMFSKKEAWHSLSDSSYFKKFKKQHSLFVIDILRGEITPTVPECKEIFEAYRGCPCYFALKDLTDFPIAALDKSHQQILDCI